MNSGALYYLNRCEAGGGFLHHEGVLRGCTTWRAAPFPPLRFRQRPTYDFLREDKTYFRD